MPTSPDRTMRELFRQRLAQYGSYVAEIAASLTAESDIVYSPIEPLLLPWPWCRGRVVIGGDAAHTFAPHLTQGAAMAAEDAFVLAREVLADDVPIEARLMRYSRSAIRVAPSSTRSPANGCMTSNRSGRRRTWKRPGPS